MYEKAVKALKKFMESWKAKNWIEMYEYTQKTWQIKHLQLVTEIPPCQQYLGNIDILDYKIGGAYKSNDFAKIFKIPNPLICIDIIVDIKYANHLLKESKESGGKYEWEKKKIKMRMICEESAYQLSEKGDWGVSIVSLLRINNA